jgi:hypothetical protein
MSRLVAAVGTIVLAAALAGCGEGLKKEVTERAQQAAGTETAERTEATSSSPLPNLEPARCPSGVPGCREATGTILYVEAVDPDGDGDAHFVLASDEGISWPGVSIIDCERDLRPHPLPKVGDRISAAGPVYRGSYGQRQIQAVVLHTAAGP